MVAFRLAPPNKTSAELDTLNRELLEEVHRDGSILLSPTLLDGALTVRLCVLSFRTHQAHVTQALELIHQAAQKVLKRHAASAST